MNELHSTRKILDEECERRQAEDFSRQQLAVASWLNGADSASDHEDALVVYENDPESGRWLFQQSLIKNWIKSVPSRESLLWIHGKPGAGMVLHHFC
jgi:hypothetical protein